ncbi:hypothetical protein, partial [Kitasatospora aureofaciens]|uniref:hypothetical protein n=1 Tax=Kitasatospora aureofaciens TaxID=1894 RepID=UPI00131E4284
SALVITVALAVPLVKVTDAPETGTPLHSTTAVTLVGWPTTTGPTSGWITTEQLDGGATVTVMGTETTPEHAHAVPVAVTVAVTVAGP